MIAEGARRSSRAQHLVRSVGLLAAILLCLSSGQAADGILGGLLKAMGIGGRPVEVPAADPAFEQINEFSPLLNRLLNAELFYIQKITHPPDEQIEQLRKVGTGEVARLARQLAEKQRNSNETPDVRRQLADALAKEMETAISVDAARQYREETAARAQFRRVAATELIISAVDRELVLSAEQAGTFKEILLKEPESGGIVNLQGLMYPQFVPWPNQASVKDVLHPNQNALFQKHPRHGRIHFGWENDLGFNGWMNIPEAILPTRQAPAIQEKKK